VLRAARKGAAAMRQQATVRVESQRWNISAALKEGGSLRKAANLLNAKRYRVAGTRPMDC